MLPARDHSLSFLLDHIRPIWLINQNMIITEIKNKVITYDPAD